MNCFLICWSILFAERKFIEQWNKTDASKMEVGNFVRHQWIKLELKCNRAMH